MAQEKHELVLQYRLSEQRFQLFIVKIVSLSFLLILFVFQAFAAELRMDRSVCQYVIKHIPDADVTYRPGEDVEGRKVAPADLNPSPINKTIEHEIAIKLFNNTAQVFG